MSPSPVPILNDEVLLDARTAPENDDAQGKTHEFTKPATDVPTSPIDTDVLIIGAGFSGISAIYRARKNGLHAKIFESASDFGGVWHWNRYPGARVDSEMPFYQLSIPEVFRDWTFSERFPDHRELRRYAEHVDQVLGLRKDTYFNARVSAVEWDEGDKRWTIRTCQGHEARAKYVVLCSGLLHRTYTPDFPGLGEYKGEVYHTGAWDEKFNAKGKKVGIIGAGATAVQVTQELGKEADELTVFVRRPSNCIPMGQRPLTALEQHQLKSFYPSLFEAGRKSTAGFPFAPPTSSIADSTEEEREKGFQYKWNAGGFQFPLSFNDTVTNKDSNAIMYDFWRRKVCERLTDPDKNAIMAPKKMPYYFLTKRTPLEVDYYDVLNRPNVKIQDLQRNPLKSFSKRGLVMGDETEIELDAVIFATGFDSFRGSMSQMGIRGKKGKLLKDEWEEQGVSTYLGLTMPGYPNLFMIYSPQAPTALSNGPTIIECQADLVTEMITRLETEHKSTIEPTVDAATEWAATLKHMESFTLFPHTDSWWNGTNIPGRKAQTMNFVAGIQTYEGMCRGAVDEGWKGFEIS